MEQHSIPRNITGFQFRLIGDMTLKQFGYLAGGSILGYALFKLLPLPAVINFGIAGLVFLIGFAFAFLPYEDRPLDQWLLAFIKSVYSPTQFIYRKENSPPEILIQVIPQVAKKFSGEQKKQFIDSKKMLEAYLGRLPKGSIDLFDQNEKMALAKTLSLFAYTTKAGAQEVSTKQAAPQKTQIKPTPSSFILETKKVKPTPPPVHAPKIEKEEEKEKQAVETGQMRQLESELVRLRQQIKEGAQAQKIDPNLEKRFLELERNLTSLLTERERLTQEIARLRQKESLGGKTVTPQMSFEEPEKEPRVRMISQQQATKVGILNPPTTPNLIIGVIYDLNGASLANILITVKDIRGTPLRALKTNKLGQFFASTPLSNGTYVLEIEDPQKRFAFDLVQLKLVGQIVQPLAITAKRQPDLVREKLSKELFSKTFT